jgi:hypothetical protein
MPVDFFGNGYTLDRVRSHKRGGQTTRISGRARTVVRRSNRDVREAGTDAVQELMNGSHDHDVDYNTHNFFGRLFRIGTNDGWRQLIRMGPNAELTARARVNPAGAAARRYTHVRNTYRTGHFDFDVRGPECDDVLGYTLR